MARVLIIDDNRTVCRLAQDTLETVGHDVTIALGGPEGFERAQNWVPDLILLDHRMPVWDGVQTAEAIRSVVNLRNVPLVWMTAMERALGETVLNEISALDCIRKPFGPEALTAVVTNALQRKDGGVLTVVQPLPKHTRGDIAPPSEGTVAYPTLAYWLAKTLGPTIRDGLQSGSLSDQELAGRFTPKLTELVSQWPASKETESSLPGDVSFEGRLDHVALGMILQLLQYQQYSGVLELANDFRKVLVCLRDGMVDIAIAEGDHSDYLLGRYLLEEELVEKAELENITAYRGTTTNFLGAHLVRLGYITEDDLHRALVRQTSELIYETLRWRSGTFRFRRGATIPSANAQLGLPIASVLLEGLRRVDEWRLIEEQIHSFDQVMHPLRDAIASLNFDLLAADERRILETVNGQRTVRDIMNLVHMGPFETCKILFQLMTSQLITASRPSRV